MSLPIFHELAFPTSRSPTGKNRFNTFATVQPAFEVPEINAVDTLGAGDVFHGAVIYILRENFTNALAAAARSPLILVDFSGHAAGWKW